MELGLGVCVGILLALFVASVCLRAYVDPMPEDVDTDILTWLDISDSEMGEGPW